MSGSPGGSNRLTYNQTKVVPEFDISITIISVLFVTMERRRYAKKHWVYFK